jgi:hypothetical protein
VDDILVDLIFCLVVVSSITDTGFFLFYRVDEQLTLLVKNQAVALHRYENPIIQRLNLTNVFLLVLIVHEVYTSKLSTVDSLKVTFFIFLNNVEVLTDPAHVLGVKNIALIQIQVLSLSETLVA